MPPVRTPSSIIADALAAFSKATNLALATVQEQAKADVAHAVSDVAAARKERDAARKERDEALKALHAIELEEKEWQRNDETWKAVIDKSEMTVKHHTETIAQLRDEAQQWKAQLQRLEESSRRELQDWKEQYMRAEQERCRLSARIDELLSEQHVGNSPLPAGLRYTPRSKYPAEIEPTSSATKRASTSYGPLTSKYAEDGAIVARKSKSTTIVPRITADSAKTFQDAHNAETVYFKASRSNPIVDLTTTPGNNQSLNLTSTSRLHEELSQPHSRVIRRVQAIFEVPVKEEDEDVDRFSPASESSPSDTSPEYEPEIPRRTSRKVRPPLKSRRPRVLDDVDDDSGEIVESEQRRKSRKYINTRVEEDEDDELIMGPGDDEVFGAQRVLVTSEVNTPPRSRVTAAPTTQPPSGKKRKLENPTSGRITNGKIPRKKR